MFNAKDHIGRTVTIAPRNNGARSVETKFGPKNAFAADVSVDGVEEYEDVLLFNAALVSRCRKANGKPFTGTLEYVTGVSGERTYLDLV
jgi:hypothetical protein